jgi:hypothetical protein
MKQLEKYGAERERESGSGIERGMEERDAATSVRVAT